MKWERRQDRQKTAGGRQKSPQSLSKRRTGQGYGVDVDSGRGLHAEILTAADTAESTLTSIGGKEITQASGASTRTSARTAIALPLIGEGTAQARGLRI